MENESIPTVVLRNPATTFIGQKVIYYRSLSSTMDTGRRLARNGAPEGTVIIAGRQTAGRGRLKRLWLSPEGSIALSLILYPPRPYLPLLVMTAALAVAHTIEKATGLESQIKWPNDILIRGKKVCGILIETDVQPDTVKYAIAGIGINVNTRMAGLPEIRGIATSLADELGCRVSRVALVRYLLEEAERLYLSLPAPEPVYREWRDRLVTLGKKVRVISGDTPLEGTAESANIEGNLLLRLPDGCLQTIVAGDVTLRDAE